MDYQDFLVELGTEELPPKSLSKLSSAFSQSIIRQIKEAGLSFSDKKACATPRRLGLFISKLSTSQPDKFIERKGPAIQAAFKDGQATPAAKGFARSCGVDVESLETLETDKGAWLVHHLTQPGKAASELLPAMITTALNELPIPKRMRWGVRRDEFVRPVHWLVMLLGTSIVECNIMGLKAGRETFGHRIHSQGPLVIDTPSHYESLLESQGKIIADFDRRKQIIQTQTEAAASAINGKAVMEESLLNEVTGLVEWPIAITGGFDQSFLRMPSEALISSMQEHQKYFPVVDSDNKLLPNFICITNLESKDMAQVVAGNERVIRPRLADAQFFYDTDQKTTLEAKREKLKSIVFQKQLGSIFDKTERVAMLAVLIAQAMNLGESNVESQHTEKAAKLSKSDLVSEMVQEFPELQGIMGRYYAKVEALDDEVCLALEEQYLPRFSGDRLPSTHAGCAIAIADKLDTIVGIFGIKQSPSGNKDPFALRRATLGVLRIIIEKSLPLHMDDLISWAKKGFEAQNISLSEPELSTKVTAFMLDRLRSWSMGESLPAETFIAVNAVTPKSPYDFYCRMTAVEAFRNLPESGALAQANKRVANILAKSSDMLVPNKVDESLLTESTEKNLYALLKEKSMQVKPLLDEKDYSGVLMSLATLKQPVDNFFDQVLVNTEDLAVKANRYALLNQLRQLFLQVADISLI